jgi:tetratricopeptide (TPR) repeat protein
LWTRTRPFQELLNRETEAAVWDSLGHAHHHLGHSRQAVDCYERALAILREFDDRFRQATVLDHLGDTRNAMGEHDLARAAWQETLRILGDNDQADAEGIRVKLHRLTEAAPDR